MQIQLLFTWGSGVGAEAHPFHSALGLRQKWGGLGRSEGVVRVAETKKKKEREESPREAEGHSS